MYPQALEIQQLLKTPPPLSQQVHTSQGGLDGRSRNVQQLQQRADVLPHSQLEGGSSSRAQVTKMQGIFEALPSHFALQVRGVNAALEMASEAEPDVRSNGNMCLKLTPMQLKLEKRPRVASTQHVHLAYLPPVHHWQPHDADGSEQSYSAHEAHNSHDTHVEHEVFGQADCLVFTFAGWCPEEKAGSGQPRTEQASGTEKASVHTASSKIAPATSDEPFQLAVCESNQVQEMNFAVIDGLWLNVVVALPLWLLRPATGAHEHIRVYHHGPVPIDHGASISVDFGLDNVACEVEPLRHSLVVQTLTRFKDMQQQLSSDTLQPSPTQHGMHLNKAGLDSRHEQGPSVLWPAAVAGGGWAQDTAMPAGYAPMAGARGRGMQGGVPLGVAHTPRQRMKDFSISSTPYAGALASHQKRAPWSLGMAGVTDRGMALDIQDGRHELGMQSDMQGQLPRHVRGGMSEWDLLGEALRAHVTINVLVQHVRLEARLLSLPSHPCRVVLDIGRPASAAAVAAAASGIAGDKEVGCTRMCLPSVYSCVHPTPLCLSII